MWRIPTSIVLASLTLAAGSLHAQPYPNRPVKIVIAFPPGGPPDIVARVLAPAVGEALGQNVIVENRAGASGFIGTGFVSNSPPDGYTVMVGSIATHATNAAMYKQLPYDPVGGFTPISLLAETPIVLVANPKFPAKSMSELIELAKKGEVAYGSNSYGSTAHLSAELLQLRAGIKMIHAPYKGSTPMLTDLIGGQIPVAFDNLPPSLPHIKDGRIRILAVSSAQRSPSFPQVPTFAESGIKDYSASAWYGIFGPPNLSRPIVDSLNAAFMAALKKPEIKARLEELGLTVVPGGPDALVAKVASQIKTWRSVVETNGIERQ
jgi:tripartite-type tricarboxylate transporter receptor subunit TctC